MKVFPKTGHRGRLFIGYPAKAEMVSRFDSNVLRNAQNFVLHEQNLATGRFCLPDRPFFPIKKMIPSPASVVSGKCRAGFRTVKKKTLIGGDKRFFNGRRL